MCVSLVGDQEWTFTGLSDPGDFTDYTENKASDAGVIKLFPTRDVK